MILLALAPLLAACSGPSLTSPDLSYPTVSHLVIAAGVSQFECGQTGGPIQNATAIAVDRSGNLYIGQNVNATQHVSKVTPDGTVTVFAGNDRVDKFHASDDGRPAISVVVDAQGLTVDASGTVFIADPSGHVLRVGTDGRIHLVAGRDDTYRYSGDGGPARQADLYWPTGLAADPLGNLYISDSLAYRVRRVSPDGRIITIAGNGTQGSREGPGSEGDGGLATSAQLHQPIGLALDAAGNLYIADVDAVRKVTRDGMITTIAGNGAHANSGFGGSAVNAALDAVHGIALDQRGNLYIAAATSQDGSALPDQDGGLFVVTPDGIMHKIVPATVGTNVNEIRDVTSDPQGNIYYASECGVYRLGSN